MNPMSIDALRRRLAEAERVAAAIREELERALWLRDYESPAPVAGPFNARAYQQQARGQHAG